MAEIWNAGNVRDLRAALNTGGSRFCGDCPLKLPLADDDAPVVRSVDAGALPSRLYVECTAACNISCFEACCAPETGITRTRQAGMLDFALFTRVIDEAGLALDRVDFFSYGETFLHKRAVEMCEYIKQTAPADLPLHEHERPGAERERRPSGWSTPVSTRSPSRSTARIPESYARYRQRGRLDVALRHPADDGATRSGAPGATCRSSTGATSCSTGTTARTEMHHARELAAEIGVDRLTWEITDHPESAYSRRFRPGDSRTTPRFGTRSGTTTTSATAIPGAPPRAPASTLPARRGAGTCLWSDGAEGGSDYAHARSQPVEPALPGPGDLRPPARTPGRPALHVQRSGNRP